MPCSLSALDLTPMRVNLLYFASFRDAAGLSAAKTEVRAKVAERLYLAFPEAAAVNREYVDGEKVLSDGDEVTFLPPVAGG